VEGDMVHVRRKSARWLRQRSMIVGNGRAA
jgi:hypothetical protein